MMDYTKSRNGEAGWLIEEALFDERHTGKCEAIFSQGNGYLGLRNAVEERYQNEKRDMFITGTFNKASLNEVTELPNVPDITGTELEINGERFRVSSKNTKNYSRVLDLYTGETIRSMTWESEKGEAVRLVFHRFVSADNVHVIGNYIEITPISCDAVVTIVSGIDAQVTNSGAQHFTEVTKRVYEEKYLEYSAVTTESEVTVFVGTAHRVTIEGEEHPVKDMRILDDRRRIHCRYELEIPQGKTVRFEKLSSVHSTRDKEYEAAEQEARERIYQDGLDSLKAALDAGYDRLFADSAATWAALWEDQDIQIDSEKGFDQLAIRFALYHLQIMVRKDDSRVGIGAKGLSGEGYKGHSFWDTETFIFPYFQMAQPQVARTLLEYRYKGLYGARLKAQDRGYEGAMYPWESAWISDGEVTPWIIGVDVHNGKPMYCLTGVIEIHITADITYALWQYYIATGDEDFMERYGYEILIDTARFWNSRLEWAAEKGRYEINDVIGPDEYKEHVNNNAYTNYLAKYNMDLAVHVINLLQEQGGDVYQRLSKLTDLDVLKQDLLDKASKLYLPGPDADTGIIPQFDGYFDLKEIDLTPYKQASVVGTLFQDYSMEDIQKYQAGKQADVVELLYQMEDLVSPELRRSNYFYYEARTLHDSSLSKAIHSVMACDLGLSKEAYDMFARAAATDMGPEMRSSDAGIHSANMGGIWQDVVMGFGGVRISQGALRISPHLPGHWKKLSYPLCWRGSRLKVTVTQDRVEIVNDGDAEIVMTVAGRETVIKKGKNTVMIADIS